MSKRKHKSSDSAASPPPSKREAPKKELLDLAKTVHELLSESDQLSSLLDRTGASLPKGGAADLSSILKFVEEAMPSIESLLALL